MANRVFSAVGMGLALLAGMALPVEAADPGIDNARAHFNYMMHCQGCHLADASGTPNTVPRMKDFVGYFFRIPGGREFLAQVPGSANAAIDDAQLAELLNWMILKFAGDSLAADFQPYTAEEVAALRRDPLMEVEGLRSGLIKKIAALGIDTSAQ